MILDDLATKLSSQGIGTCGTTLFKAFFPESPDAAVCLFKTAGLPPVHAMSSGPDRGLADRPRVAVWARDSRPDGAEKKLQDVQGVLDALGGVPSNGIIYRSVYALQSPFFLKTDESGRFIYAQNYEVIRDPASSS